MGTKKSGAMANAAESAADGHASGIAVRCRSACTAIGGMPGCLARISATTPVACGAAIEVPWTQP